MRCPDELVCSPLTQTCEHSVIPPDSGAPHDADLDGPPKIDAVAPDAGCTSFSVLFDTCSLTPGPPRSITSATTIDTATDADTVVMLNGQEIAVIAVESLGVGTQGSVTVTGARPLAFVVFGSATIGGQIKALAGARTACNSPGGKGLDDGGGGSGGGGGGFHGGGGGGGTGDSDQSPADGGAGGAAQTVPATLLGGCNGGDGGRGTVASGTPGRGGVAGGGIAIVARTAIDIAGAITAPGGGSLHPNCADCGGGGGGSGGMIYLESAAIHVAGTLAANGGGGSGANGVQSPLSTDGSIGQANANAAQGGQPSPGGSAGGAGAASSTLAGNGGAISTGGAGGGGGGAGWIITRGTFAASGVVSPPPLTL